MLFDVSAIEGARDDAQTPLCLLDEVFRPGITPAPRVDEGNVNLELQTKTSWNGALEAASKALNPGVSALSTRIAALGLAGDLHIDFGRLITEISRVRTPLSTELVNRIETMKADNWRFWEIPLKDLGARGQYDARAREVLVARDRSIAGYVLGATNEHPRESMVAVLSHEVAHNEGLKHLPDRFLNGQTPERLDAFRLLAHETNAMMAEMHIEQNRHRITISDGYHLALQSGELGAEIRHSYIAMNPELKSITEVEATEFVEEYVGERWGDPLDADGRVKSYSLNPPTSALAESKVFDPPGLEHHAADFEKERIEMDSENRRYKIARLCQTGSGAATIHGIKIVGALGAVAAVHAVRNSFNDSFGSGLAEMARMGVGFCGFEAGTALARFGNVAPIRRALVLGFAGAYAAEHSFGTPLYNNIRAALH
ncbi:MAG: hypothetical protein K2W95_13505 [Candidatus Obscuribacterales bacterium]|nr:hypothetical protein [Candidatus Obscuribacterales bacterium]